MAKSPIIRVSFLSDTKDLVKGIDKAESSLDDFADASKRAGDGLDRAGEAADTMDTRAMGFRDTMTGVEDTMKGVGEIAKGDLFSGFLTLGMGIGDLGSGIYNFVIPGLKALSLSSLTAAKDMVASAAKQGVAWVKLGVQSLLHAGKVAAAWLIAMGPIALVIAAVIAVVALIILNWEKVSAFLKRVWEGIKRTAENVWNAIKAFFKSAIDAVVKLFQNWTLPGLIAKHWDKIKDGVRAVRDWIKDTWNGLIDWFKKLPGRVSGALGGLFDGLKNAFKSAVNWVIDKWNGFKLQIKLPALLGGGTIGIDTPNIPRFHSGGIFRSLRPGGEGLALLRDGEEVLTPGQRRGQNGGNTYHVVVNALDPAAAAKAVVQALQEYERKSGPIPVNVRPLGV